ncbi:MAG: GlmU family protein [Balneolaceae bacterium]|nr:GlmU family protein [Balneolaceae bacterium]
MQLCFFEDAFHRKCFPLTLTRPVDDLRTGIFTLGEKWRRALKAETSARILRPELKGVFGEGRVTADESCYWINARFLPEEDLLAEISDLKPGSCLMHDGTVVAACAEGERSAAWLEQGQPDFNELFVIEVPRFHALRNLWDLFQKNGGQIRADLKLLETPGHDAPGLSPAASLVHPERIHIAKDATVEPGCVLHAGDGPIYIGKGATVMAGSVLRGPLAVCEGSTIKAGAKIYGGTTIGPVCKVGGEVNNSIFHSYSNKAHDGFTGNSLFGQWVNLGADTNTSNLKNNYSTIRITDWESRTEIETGQQFLGTVMGDHSKTAINTQLNTGTVCGVCCNIFSSDFPPKLIPSFSWVGSNVIQPYRLQAAYDAMEAMMARRDVELTDPYREMMRLIFNSEH